MLVFSTIIKYAIRNILRSRMRSFFTLFSIVLIITLYTILTSIGNSFTTQISKVLKQQDFDIVVQARYASSPASSKISSGNVKKINQIEHVARSESLLISRKRVGGRDSVFMLGVSDYDTFSRRLGFSLIKGRTPDTKEYEVVIGEKMAKILRLDVDDKLQLDNGKKFRISGIFSSWLNFINAGILVDLSHAQRLTGKLNQSSLLFLSLDDITKTTMVIDDINKMLPDLRAINSFQFPDHIGSMKSLFVFSKIVSLLTLIIAVAVLLNTFIMAISERTKEVGILSAIGWPRSLIISVFLCESLLLAFSGGVLGYLVAFPAMSTLQYNFTSVYMYFPDSPDIYIFFNVLLMCLAVGLLSALFPALYGTKIQIAEALHHE